MKKLSTKFRVGIVLTLVIFVYPLTIAEAGHNHVWGELRVDLPEVYNAQGYQVIIMALEQPSNGYPDYTDGWIGLELDNICESQPGFGCAQFIQIGILTKSNGPRWFVYAEPGVTCHRGAPAWGGLGCEGINDFVSLGNWYKVELQKHPTNWTAVVYDTNNTAYTVASINSGNQRIYRAYVDMEEAYWVPQDPFMIAKFNYFHPKYSSDNVYYLDWPVSLGDQGTSYIDAGDDDGNKAFCPSIYSFEPPMLFDERYWYIGSPNPHEGVCEGLLLPSSHLFIPIMIKN